MDNEQYIDKTVKLVDYKPFEKEPDDSLYGGKEPKLYVEPLPRLADIVLSTECPITASEIMNSELYTFKVNDRVELDCVFYDMVSEVQEKRKLDIEEITFLVDMGELGRRQPYKLSVPRLVYVDMTVYILRGQVKSGRMEINE